MNPTIEAVKDETAKKHGKITWAILNKYYLDICSDESAPLRKRRESEEEFFAIENEAILLYHYRKCEEAGKELPPEEAFMVDGDNESYKNGLTDMRWAALKFLSSKQSQLEATQKDSDKWKEEARDNWKQYLEANDNILILKSKLKAKDEEIDELKTAVREYEEDVCKLADTILRLKKENDELKNQEIVLPTEYDLRNTLTNADNLVNINPLYHAFEGARYAIEEVKRLNPNREFTSNK